MYTILVIDDDEPMREVIGHILSAEFNVLTAEDAQEAIDLLSDNSVNLVLSDIYMPGMNGIQLLESLQTDSYKKDIPVLIMTNLPSEDKKELAENLGAADFIDKVLLNQDREAFLNKVRMKVLTDVRVPDLNEELNSKKNSIINCLMNEATLGSFETITDAICKQLHDLFEVNYCSFWTIEDEQPGLTSFYKFDDLPSPQYNEKDLINELDYQKLVKEGEAYFSNHIYNGETGIMNDYSIQNKLTAEIGLPLFSINEKTLLLNNMKIPKGKPVFAFLNIKRKKLFSTDEYELLKKLVKQMNPAFWRLYQQNKF